MTTAEPSTGPPARPVLVGPVVRGAFLCSALVGAVLVLAAAVASGSHAAVAALVGTTVVCLFFGAGAVVLQVVSTLLPAASLIVALLTYTLKIALLALVFIGLSRTAYFGGQAESRWLAAAVIVGTLAWSSSQLVLHTKVRQPVYDLPPRAPEASAQ